MSAFAQRSEAEQVEALRRLGAAALDAWGLASEPVALIKYRENAVFRIGAADRPQAVLRVHRPGYRSDAMIRAEAAWMRALAADGFATPAVLPTRAGEVLTVAAGDGVPEPRQCDLIGWVAGRPLGSLERGVDLDAAGVRAAYVTIGRLAAGLHDHAARWRRPDGFERPVWDVDSLVGESPAFGRFWDLDVLDAAQRKLLLDARDRVRARLQALGPVRQLVHGDLIPDNVLVDGERLNVIDFDDCGWSWPLFELATSLFPLLVSGGFDAGLEGFLSGYGEVRAFPEEELALLPDMLVARGLSYLGWPVGRPEIHSQRRGLREFAAAAVELVLLAGG